ncbi:MAG: hypothetical protein AAB833_00170 [Patescibacteria group bacterium]
MFLESLILPLIIAGVAFFFFQHGRAHHDDTMKNAGVVMFLGALGSWFIIHLALSVINQL